MLLTKEVSTKVTRKNFKNLSEYANICKLILGEYVVVPVEALPVNSTYKVRALCDYCGKEYFTSYRTFSRHGNKVSGEKDSCRECRIKKAQETALRKYGGISSFCSADVREQIQATCLKKYGGKSPLVSAGVKEKAANTNMAKYGFATPFENEEFQNSIRQLVFNKYGVSNVMKLDWVVEKGVKARHENNIACSKPQKTMFDVIQALGYDCIINYRVNRYEYDVAVFVDDVKIDIEYDGMYWHQCRTKHDEARDNYSVELGWKVIRFRSKSGVCVPTEREIISAIDLAINYERDVQIIELAS